MSDRSGRARSRRALRRQLAATQGALVELHAFVVHLDPDPAPIIDYLVDPDHRSAALAAVYRPVRG